ncbi:MAG: hypothetical protein IT285_11910 [Bdellovibrionales bacterium]|nr:hypothetical protein [Bdellovibrionales bacterium]
MSVAQDRCQVSSRVFRLIGGWNTWALISVAVATVAAPCMADSLGLTANASNVDRGWFPELFTDFLVGGGWIPSEYTAFEVQPPIRELSGAFLDSARGVIWTLGDDAPAQLGVTPLDGKWATRAIPLDATLRDWEALLIDRDGDLWVMDVGDNRSEREHVELHEIRPRDLGAPSERLERVRTLKLRYPSGPMDVEGAFMEGDRAYLVQKRYSGRARVVSALIAPHAALSQTTRAEGTLPQAIGPVTDASVSPEGRVYFLTYGGLWECVACASTARDTALVTTGHWGQAEALIAIAGDRYLIGNEAGRFFFLQ